MRGPLINLIIISREDTVRIRQFLSISGRATRTQFLSVYVLGYIVARAYLAWTSDDLILVDDLFSIKNFGVLYVLTWLGLATTVRRLHDIDASGWWLILVAVPGINYIALTVLAICSPEDDNDYGPDPRDEREATDLFRFRARSFDIREVDAVGQAANRAHRQSWP